jgi:uncharacterized protein YndB with AHSA1/START domain
MNLIVKKHIRIKAPAARVWEALSDPEQTRRYFFHARVLSDWKKDSTITFKGRMFWIIPFKMSGKIIDIKPEKLLKYTLSNRGSGSASTVTDTLSFNDGWTTLEITDDMARKKAPKKGTRVHKKAGKKC